MAPAQPVRNSQNRVRGFGCLNSCPKRKDLCVSSNALAAMNSSCSLGQAAYWRSARGQTGKPAGLNRKRWGNVYFDRAQSGTTIQRSLMDDQRLSPEEAINRLKGVFMVPTVNKPALSRLYPRPVLYRRKGTVDFARRSAALATGLPAEVHPYRGHNCRFGCRLDVKPAFKT